MAAGVREIKVRFSGDSSGLANAAAAGEKSMGRFSENTRKWAKRALAGVAALAGAAAVGAKQAIDAAAEQSANFSKFEQVTKTAMDSAHQTTARSLNLSRSSYADYYAQLSAMYQSNGLGVGKANKLAAESMATAADAAAFGNTTVGKAVEAQLGLLKGSGELWEQYSVSIKASDISARMKEKGLDDLTGAEKKAAEATVKHTLAQEAATLFLGQAAKESGSLESRQQRLVASMEDLKASIGAKLLPVAIKFAGVLAGLLTWVENNSTKAKILAAVIGGLAAAVALVSGVILAWNALVKIGTALQKTWTVLTKVSTIGVYAQAAAIRIAAAAQAALNLVMKANPAVRIALIVMALVAAVIALYQKSDTARRIIHAAFDGIKRVISAVYGWIKSHWPLLLAILTGPFGLAVYAISKNKDRILGIIRAIPDAARRIFGGLAEILTAPFRGAVAGFRAAWNNTIGGKGFSFGGWDPPGPGSIPGVSFEIPRLASGGVAHANMAHLVGEHGTELFIPNRTGTVVPNDILDGLGGDLIVELHGNRDALDAVVERVIVRHNRGLRRAVLAGAARSF